MDLYLVIAGGLFSLGGVLLGGLLAPLTQLYIEGKREKRAAGRAKLLVAAELLHAQLILRTASLSKCWPLVEDVNSFLPTSAWRENRAHLVGKVHEDLWNELVMTYALLETDRARFLLMCHSPKPEALPAKEAEGLKQTFNDLGRLRRKLGAGGGFPDAAINSTEGVGPS